MRCSVAKRCVADVAQQARRVLQLRHRWTVLNGGWSQREAADFVCSLWYCSIRCCKLPLQTVLRSWDLHHIPYSLGLPVCRTKSGPYGLQEANAHWGLATQPHESQAHDLSRPAVYTSKGMPWATASGSRAQQGAYADAVRYAPLHLKRTNLHCQRTRKGHCRTCT